MAAAVRQGPARDAALDALVPRLLTCEPRALGRAISLIEDGGAAQRALVARIYGATGRAKVVGVTGPPGVGKSTLVDRLARLLRARGETVGILAVDPTSPFTGGALLGDRIRMQGLYTDPGVFIRSMATRGTMGGLARATRDAVDLLDAAGFDWVLVETVGVGQDEVDVVRSVDTVLVVTVPGLGDDIQAIKAGLLEIADVFVLNKADRDGADRTEHDLRFMLQLSDRDEAAAHGEGASGHAAAAGAPTLAGAAPAPWLPPIVRTVASREEGLPRLLEEVERHRAWLVDSGELARRRRTQLRLRVETILKARVLAEADQVLGMEREVERGFAAQLDPYAVAERLFAGVLEGREPALAAPAAAAAKPPGDTE